MLRGYEIFSDHYEQNKTTKKQNTSITENEEKQDIDIRMKRKGSIYKNCD